MQVFLPKKNKLRAVAQQFIRVYIGNLRMQVFLPKKQTFSLCIPVYKKLTILSFLEIFGESKISSIFLFKNLGSVHYPKGLKKSLWAKSCYTRLRPKTKDKI